MSRGNLTRLAFASFLVMGTATASAQTFKGTASCGGSECHTRSGEVDWLNTKPGGKEHRESLRRLKGSLDVSEKYAKAVGLENVFEPKGMCIKCHGTYVEAGKATEGVGCEGCHGPAGGYRDFHQQNPKDYKGAVGRGLRNLQGAPTTWTRVCTGCHVLSNKPEYDTLIEAGHKDGNRWKPQSKFTGVQAHWKRVSYTVDVITAAAAGKAVTVAVAPTAAPAPAAPPAKPEPPTAPAPTPAPAAAPPTPPASPAGSPPAPRPPVAAPTAPPPARGTPLPPPVSAPLPSTLPPPAPADPIATGATVASPLALTPPPPSTASELLGALQNRLSGFFARLLRSGVSPEVPLKPLPAPARITGPDGELLQLQAEALALAIEALNLKAKPGARSPSDK